jgi:hypothetical protein
MAISRIVNVKVPCPTCGQVIPAKIAAMTLAGQSTSELALQKRARCINEIGAKAHPRVTDDAFLQAARPLLAVRGIIAS